MFKNVVFENARIFADNKKIVRFTVKADDYILIADYSLKTGELIDEEFTLNGHPISCLDGCDEPTWQYTYISDMLVKHYWDALEVLYGVEYLRQND